jgi:hypothetical protein
MAFSSRALTLRRFLSVARKLRGLADGPADSDRDLLLAAAQALEDRAKRMATTLPGEKPTPAVQLHNQVDLLI